jgi:hypothetical protein
MHEQQWGHKTIAIEAGRLPTKIENNRSSIGFPKAYLLKIKLGQTGRLFNLTIAR